MTITWKGPVASRGTVKIGSEVFVLTYFSLVPERLFGTGDWVEFENIATTTITSGTIPALTITAGTIWVTCSISSTPTTGLLASNEVLCPDGETGFLGNLKRWITRPFGIFGSVRRYFD